MLWGERMEDMDGVDEMDELDGRTRRELTDIEVDEVSLVDRPATGRRFVLFKRGPRRAAAGGGGNIRSCAGGETDVAELAKRADDLREEVRGLREAADRLEERLDERLAALEGAGRPDAGAVERLEKRLAALEAGRPARQSDDAALRRESLWAGLL